MIFVTVVVLAVNFMGAIFAGRTKNLLQYEVAIDLPIAALEVFVAFRTSSVKIAREVDRTKKNLQLAFSTDSNSKEDSASE